MALDDDIKHIKNSQRIIMRSQRIIYNAIPGKLLLYGILGVTMVAGIKSCNRTAEIRENMQATPQLQIQNVIGQEAPEKFYVINGQRVYLEVDEKHVEQYFRR
jgi:hypothetical protein